MKFEPVSLCLLYFDVPFELLNCSISYQKKRTYEFVNFIWCQIITDDTDNYNRAIRQM